MNRRTFLKTTGGGLAMAALAGSLQVAEASPRLRLLPMGRVPWRVRSAASRFTAEITISEEEVVPLQRRSRVLRYRATPPWWQNFTAWIFFFGAEGTTDDVDLILSIGVPDDPDRPVFIELTRLAGAPVEVYKDDEQYIEFTGWPIDQPDTPYPGYSVGFLE
jgi:hypothetical protein